MKKLIIIRGLPGSGKSTFAKSLVSSGFADVFCEADQYFVDTEGHYKYDGMKIQEAHADCLLRVMGYLELHKTVVVCNTFTTERELHPYISYCQTHKVPFVSLIVENRHGNQSIHGVPEVTMDKMRDRFTFSLDDKIMSRGTILANNRQQARLEELFILQRATIEL